MARYRAVIVSRGGDTSRCGDKKTGMVVNVNGWRGGVRVVVRYDELHERDVFTIYGTSGSGSEGTKERFIDQVAT